MKNIRSFLVLLTVAATIAGMILIGNEAPFETGRCFSAAKVFAIEHIHASRSGNLPSPGTVLHPLYSIRGIMTTIEIGAFCRSSLYARTPEEIH